MIEINTVDSEFNKLLDMECFTNDTKETVQKADIAFLPDFNLRKGIERAFQPDTINFYKYVKQKSNDYRVEIFENKEDVRILSLHSFDIWLPTMWIANIILLPIAINLVSSYVYDKLKGRNKDEATVQLRIVIEDKSKGKSASIFYKGPGKELKENFEKIDASKLWED
jgi:hypothetical protein